MKTWFIFVLLFWITLKPSFALDCSLQLPIKTILPKYSKAFQIKIYKDFKQIIVGDETLFVSSHSLLPCRFKGRLIRSPVKKVALYSTTYLPALEMLNQSSSLAGFENKKYIVTKKIKLDQVVTLGSEFNLELLYAQKFDLIMAHKSLYGKKSSMELVEKLKLPVVPNNDWEEKSPLARAEWLIYIASFYNEEELALKLFAQIDQRYSEIKLKNLSIKDEVKVLVGDIEQGFWSAPGGESDLAQILKDAKAQLLLYRPTRITQRLSLEHVVSEAMKAEVWLPHNLWKNQEERLKAQKKDSRYLMIKASKIYNNTKIINSWGFNDYWESGMQRPDLLLEDISAILHPDKYPNYQYRWYKAL